MPSYQTIRHVPHSAAEMFALVADVESYPEFVPLCESLRVISRERNGTDEIITATMTVAYKFIHESFTTRVQVRRDGLEIVAEHVDGPFTQLLNRWRFHPAGNGGTDIEFYISYAFKSRALRLLMGSLFNKAVRKYTTAFERRADQIYRAGLTETKSATGQD
jgi:coenzyme Q-binding protein COQ10